MEREQCRQRRDRELAEEREIQLARSRDYITKDDVSNKIATQQSAKPENDYNHDDVTNELPLFDDPLIIRKISQFCNEMMASAFNQCSVCLKNFPFSSSSDGIHSFVIYSHLILLSLLISIVITIYCSQNNNNYIYCNHHHH